MSTATITTPTFEIVSTATGFAITRDGIYLTDRHGNVRTFVTRNAARKRISRERRGSFHI